MLQTRFCDTTCLHSRLEQPMHIMTQTAEEEVRRGFPHIANTIRKPAETEDKNFSISPQRFV